MKHYPREKDAFTKGFETMMNNHQASMLTNPHIFNEIVSQSGMTATQAIRHIGKGKKPKRDEQRQHEERLKNLENKTN